MRKIICLIMLVGLLAMGSTAIAANISGWGKAKFGMNYSELSKLYKINEPSKLEGRGRHVYTSNAVSEIVLKRQTWDLSFSLDKNKNLIGITIFKIGDCKTDDEIRKLRSSVNDVLISLTGKYGNPSITKNILGPIYQWNSNKSRITFKSNIEVSKTVNFHIITLKYLLHDEDI